MAGDKAKRRSSRYQVDTDDERTAYLRKLERDRHSAIRLLGTPAWRNKSKVAEVLERRIALEARCDILEDVISAGYHPSIVLPANVNIFSHLWLEWLTVSNPDAADADVHVVADWEDLADALRRGFSHKNKRFASLLKKHDTPEYIEKLIADRKATKFPRARPREKVEDRRARSKVLKADEYFQQAGAFLRVMYPGQKRADVNLRAKEIAANKYGIEEQTLRNFRKLPKADDRRFTGKPRPKPKYKRSK